MRAIIKYLQNRFITVSTEESLAIDEQICATKVRHHLKQYVLNKPHKWGYKLFFLCGISGYAYKFEVYTGQENDPSNRPINEPDLGPNANIVVRLSRDIPRFKNHKLYFDNYYTSVPLVVYLFKKGILSLETIRRNRIPNSKLPSEADMNKMPRGTSIEYTAIVDNVEVSNVSWKDNKIGNSLSSFVGKEAQIIVRRYDRKLKTHLD
ncbi:hypothetical protein ILUMI_27348, partial [Ignelater luminosus]